MRAGVPPARQRVVGGSGEQNNRPEGAHHRPSGSSTGNQSGSSVCVVAQQVRALVAQSVDRSGRDRRRRPRPGQRAGAVAVRPAAPSAEWQRLGEVVAPVQRTAVLDEPAIRRVTDGTGRVHVLEGQIVRAVASVVASVRELGDGEPLGAGRDVDQLVGTRLGWQRCPVRRRLVDAVACTSRDQRRMSGGLRCDDRREVGPRAADRPRHRDSAGEATSTPRRTRPWPSTSSVTVCRHPGIGTERRRPVRGGSDVVELPLVVAGDRARVTASGRRHGLDPPSAAAARPRGSLAHRVRAVLSGRTVQGIHLPAQDRTLERPVRLPQLFRRRRYAVRVPSGSSSESGSTAAGRGDAAAPGSAQNSPARSSPKSTNAPVWNHVLREHRRHAATPDPRWTRTGRRRRGRGTAPPCPTARPCEAAELALDAVEVAVVVHGTALTNRLPLIRSTVSTRVDHVHRERQPRHPRRAGCASAR